MTEEQIKELVSSHFVSVIASVGGIKCFRQEHDHGVDITFTPLTKRTSADGSIRYLDSANKLDVQLKATTKDSVTIQDQFICYDLKSKNYNDLIFRINDVLPLHLILVVLDSNPPSCLEVSSDDLRLFGKAYWFLPDRNENSSSNSSTKRIRIPLANQINENFLHKMYENIGVSL